MELFETLYLIPLLPLLGAAILGLLGSRMEKDLVTVIGLSSVLGSFAITALAVAYLVKTGVPLEDPLYRWIAVGRYTFNFTLGLDWLSGTLMVVVTFVGFLIHVYSVGYMHDDPGYWRYFAYLNLFIFAMSLLVLGRSLPVMFIGWEGVGLASYLLIGFWYSDQEKARAGKKAFITNRIGDFGFLLGMFTLIALFGTADFEELRRASTEHLVNGAAVIRTGLFAGYTVEQVVTGACLFLFLGACGKSAQLPLFVWLPDAMAGPTPVSALIHAATMVTAGVYMVCRLQFLFDLAPFATYVVAWVGAITAFIAATIGLAQNDIKKVLAYSTVSQLGYMFLAAGVGAYSAAIFHLFTHAFFKACLFLGSGAIIHALHGEQDMRKMGGLKDELPWVWRTFLISTLALCGVAPLSGFFSKDAILSAAFEADPTLWFIGFATAFLTALYMMRLLCLTFLGKSRLPLAHGKKLELHHPGSSMTAPLVILSAFAAVAGLFNLPGVVAHGFHHVLSVLPDLKAGAFDEWLAPAIGGVRAEGLEEWTEIKLLVLSLGVALFGLALGWTLYKGGPSPAMEKATRVGPGRLALAWLQGKWFFDEIYRAVIITPLNLLASVFSVVFDPWIIDGLAVKVSGYVVVGTGRLLRKMQTGNVQSYAAIFVIAVAAIILWAVQ
jgi:NADH-quinone oxidoreductase subunit L